MRIYLVNADVIRRNTARIITSPSCSRAGISSPLDRIVLVLMGHGIPFTPKPMLFGPSTIQNSAERRWSLSASHHRAFLIRSRVQHVSAFWKSASGNTVSVLGFIVRKTTSVLVARIIFSVHSYLATPKLLFEYSVVLLLLIQDVPKEVE